MTSTIRTAEMRHRPGGRTAKTTRRIRDAVLHLLVTRGHEACTFQAVAAAAAVERSTLYRRFPDRWAMILDAYGELAKAEVKVEPTGRFHSDLKMLIQRFVDLWVTPIGEAMLAMVATARGTPGQVQVEQFMARRFADFDPLFDGAIARGELPATANREAILERMAGVVIFRVLIANRTIDEHWVNQLAADTIRSIAR